MLPRPEVRILPLGYGQSIGSIRPVRRGLAQPHQQVVLGIRDVPLAVLQIVSIFGANVYSSEYPRPQFRGGAGQGGC